MTYPLNGKVSVWRALALLCLFGACVYAIAGFSVGAFSAAELRRVFRRQR